MITPCLPIVLVARWYTHSSLRKSSLHIITNIYADGTIIPVSLASHNEGVSETIHLDKTLT